MTALPTGLSLSLSYGLSLGHLSAKGAAGAVPLLGLLKLLLLMLLLVLLLMVVLLLKLLLLLTGLLILLLLLLLLMVEILLLLLLESLLMPAPASTFSTSRLHGLIAAPALVHKLVILPVVVAIIAARQQV